jgi:hypothetical protein
VFVSIRSLSGNSPCLCSLSVDWRLCASTVTTSYRCACPWDTTPVLPRQRHPVYCRVVICAFQRLHALLGSGKDSDDSDVLLIPSQELSSTDHVSVLSPVCSGRPLTTLARTYRRTSGYCTSVRDMGSFNLLCARNPAPRQT